MKSKNSLKTNKKFIETQSDIQAIFFFLIKSEAEHYPTSNDLEIRLFEEFFVFSLWVNFAVNRLIQVLPWIFEG